MNIRTAFIIMLALVAGGCMSINKDLAVEDGAERSGDLTTVNGTITVGSGAVVDGDLETVNGAISVGADSRVHNIETVNGSVEFGPNSRARSIDVVNGRIEVAGGASIAASVESVNGAITLGRGATVDGTVASVNGRLRLQGATAGSLENHAGGMVLERGSKVLGELRVKKSKGTGSAKPVLVEIHADCEVAGPLRFERPVTLRIHESAVVGEIIGAEPEYFDG